MESVRLDASSKLSGDTSRKVAFQLTRVLRSTQPCRQRELQEQFLRGRTVWPFQGSERGPRVACNTRTKEWRGEP